MEFCKLVKLGVKKRLDIKNAGIKFGEKVESLPFWEREQNDIMISKFDILNEDFKNDLIKVGTSIQMMNGTDNKTIMDYPMELWPLLEGILYYTSNIDSFYQNLTFVSNWGSKGHRFIHCNNPNILGITFPSDSILKSGAKKPYVIISLRRSSESEHELITGSAPTIEELEAAKSRRKIDRNLFNAVGQDFFIFKSLDYDIMLSSGKSESAKTLTARVHTTEKFLSLLGAAMSLIKKHTVDIPTKSSMTEMIMNILYLSVNVNKITHLY